MNKRTLDNMVSERLNQPYSRVLVPEDEGGYSASILELPGCFSQGESVEEAVANLEEAAANWIRETIRKGDQVPAPFTSQGYSGRVLLRLPKSLHRQASQLARQDNVSLNAFIISAVASKIGAEDLTSKLASTIESCVAELVREASSLKKTAESFGPPPRLVRYFHGAQRDQAYTAQPGYTEVVDGRFQLGGKNEWQM